MFMSLGATAHAQVQDLSVTASPVGGYTWWHKDLNLGDTPFWGVRAGFGFGPLVELRGLYERSYDLKGKLKSSNWGPLQGLADKLESENVKVERFGGELKLNLWSGTVLTPYLTAGAGVINFKYDDLQNSSNHYKEEQLYGALGAGAKINLTRRVVLSLEGKNLLFNVDKNNRYLAPGANPDRTLQNWTAQASLDFYLGGTRHYATDAVSRAYRDAFTDGFRGMKFVLEPGVAYLDFKDGSRFRDQWFIGGSAGVDFNSLLGVRGFYYRANKEADKLNFKTTDDLQLYGGNFIARLNFPRGVTPYVSLGAGYMKVDEDQYVDKQGTHLAKSGWFAMGGAGVDVPLHRTVSLYGTVNGMLNKQENLDLQNILTPSQVKVNLMYTAGVRINLGAFSRSGQNIYQAYVTDAREAERTANMDELNKMRAEYDARIARLNRELETATKSRDSERVARLLAEKNSLTNKVARVEAEKDSELLKAVAVPVKPAEKNVVLTTSQFESLVRRVVSEVKGATPQTINSNTVLGSGLTDLDKILLINALSQAQYRQLLVPGILGTATPVKEHVATPAAPVVAPAQTVDRTDMLVERLNALVDRVEALDRSNKELRQATVQAQLNRDITPVRQEIAVDYADDIRTVSTGSGEPYLKFQGLTAFTGPNFGDQFNWNAGLRGIFQMGRSNFAFAPEAFVGFGNNTGYGASANVLYGFNLPAGLRPYLGVGLGYTNVGDTGRFGTNVIVGTYIPKFLGGKLSIDYSVRNGFKNNQIAVGYTFGL